MRLCIDASPLLVRSAGVKTYLYHWIRALRRVAAGDEISLFPFVWKKLAELHHERPLAGRIATLGGLALLQARNFLSVPLPGCDVFHVSNLLWNPPRAARLTATVHDMTCWLMPELHQPRNAGASVRFGERVLTRCDRLIAVSEASRQDAIRILRLDPARIRTIHSGIDEAFFSIAPTQIRAARDRYGLGRPYFLFVGTIEPRKNVGAVLDAFAALPNSVRDEFELVVAGPHGWGDERTLARLHAPDPGVRYLGYVPEAALPGLTAGASAFLYPSLYEGFGFPVAQAMAAGVPVITSNVSSLPEIAGGAAVLIDPRSTAEIRDAIERLALSPSVCVELGKRGRERAQGFRWDVCAERSLEFLKTGDSTLNS